MELDTETQKKLLALELRVASQDVELAKLREAQTIMKNWMTHKENFDKNVIAPPLTLETIRELGERVAAQKIEIGKLSDDHETLKNFFTEKTNTVTSPKVPAATDPAAAGDTFTVLPLTFNSKSQSPMSSGSSTPVKSRQTTPAKGRSDPADDSTTLNSSKIGTSKKRTNAETGITFASPSPSKIPKTAAPDSGVGWVDRKTKPSPVKRTSTGKAKKVNIVLNRTITTTGLKSATSMPSLPPPRSVTISAARSSPRTSAKISTLASVGLTMPVRRRYPVLSPSHKKTRPLRHVVSKTSTGSIRTRTSNGAIHGSTTNIDVRRKSERETNPTIKLCYTGTSRSPTLTETLSTDNIGLPKSRRRIESGSQPA